MAKMVTRTFETHNLTFLCVDLNKNELIEKELMLASVKDDNDAIRQAKKLLEEDGRFAVVKINAHSVTEEIRGMTEEDFLKYSVPVTRPQSQMKKKEK